MTKILARVLRWVAVELMMPLSNLPDERDDRLYGWSLGLLLRGQGFVSESGKSSKK
jgi:hypothetical protein